MSTVQTILLNRGNSTVEDSYRIVHQFNQQISLYEKDIALSSYSIYYSWRNVTIEYGNRTFKYDWPNGAGFNTISVELPPGFYEINDLSGYLKEYMRFQGHYLVDDNNQEVYYMKFAPNPVYYSTTFTIDVVPDVLPVGWTKPTGNDVWALPTAATTPSLLFDNEEFGKLIGASLNFTVGPSATAFEQNSDLIPAISPATVVNIDINMVENDIQKNKTLFSFTPNKPYGSLLESTIGYPLFQKLTDGGYTNITIEFKDQLNRPLRILDEEIQISVIVRDRPKFEI